MLVDFHFHYIFPLITTKPLFKLCTALPWQESKLCSPARFIKTATLQQVIQVTIKEQHNANFPYQQKIAPGNQETKTPGRKLLCPPKYMFLVACRFIRRLIRRTQSKFNFNSTFINCHKFIFSHSLSIRYQFITILYFRPLLNECYHFDAAHFAIAAPLPANVAGNKIWISFSTCMLQQDNA